MSLLLSLALASGVDPTAVVGAPALPPPAAEEAEARTDAISKKVRCPVCQGLSVADSPSESARAMKEEVRGLVAKGYDEEQVISYFEASYGEFIRLEPTTEGWNLLVWVLPGAALAAGAGWLAWTLRRPGAAPAAPAALTPVDPELRPYVARVLAEVGEAHD